MSRKNFYPSVMLSDRQWERVQRMLTSAAKTMVDKQIAAYVSDRLEEQREWHDQYLLRIAE